MKLYEIANSSLLKLVQFVFTVIIVPIIGLGISGVLERLGKIEEAIRIGDKTSATTELRLQTTEQKLAATEASNRLLAEKVIGHEYELREIRARLNK